VRDDSKEVSDARSAACRAWNVTIGTILLGHTRFWGRVFGALVGVVNELPLGA
jgi:hypothetical protein